MMSIADVVSVIFIPRQRGRNSHFLMPLLYSSLPTFQLYQLRRADILLVTLHRCNHHSSRTWLLLDIDEWTCKILFGNQSIRDNDRCAVPILESGRMWPSTLQVMKRSIACPLSYHTVSPYHPLNTSHRSSIGIRTMYMYSHI
jgi:hypothetical protein